MGKGLLLITVTLYLLAFLVVPLGLVFHGALQQGLALYWQALSDEATLAALKLTLLTIIISVPLNTVFGIMAAWLIVKHNFPGKTLLTTLIDLPLSVSPVISGMLFVFLLGSRSPLGEWLIQHGIQFIFSPPGIVIATLFVTLPYVARELIPVMRSLGSQEEEAAMTLGASGFQTFWRITLPNIKWGLLYGVIICTARAMGEFGAVSVVSGHIRGLTNTLPLHIEILYNEYQFEAAFAVASLLTVLSIMTLAAKKWIEWKGQAMISKSKGSPTHEH